MTFSAGDAVDWFVVVHLAASAHNPTSTNVKLVGKLKCKWVFAWSRLLFFSCLQMIEPSWIRRTIRSGGNDI